MNDKVSTLLIALLGGAVAVLGVGQVTGAGADSAATSQQPMIIRVESPTAAAGGDSGTTVKLSDVPGLCALGSAPHGDGSGSGGGSARSSSRAAAAGSVNSSGNSANVNTNVLALNNQIGLEQKTVVVQDSTNAAVAAQEQGQSQGQDPTTTTEPTLTATDTPTTTAAPTTTTAAPTTTTEAPTTTLAPTTDTSGSTG